VLSALLGFSQDGSTCWLGLLLIAQVLGLISATQAVLETRTSQGAIAWAMVLISIPVIAVPAYWIFGRSHVNGYRKRRIREQLEQRLGTKLFGSLLTASRVKDERLTSGLKTLEEITGSPFTGGNQLDLLIDGEETFKSMFAGIACAKDHVLASFYLMRHDEIGEPFKRALIERAEQGVKVRIMYDGIGSLGEAGRMLDDLRQAGAKVVAFDGSRHPGNRFSLNFRNHRKIVVVDGESAWVGGLNIGREYAGMDPELGHWRDTHVCIRGPAALAVQAVVVEDWLWATGESLESLLCQPQSSQVDQSVLVAPTSPASNIETCTLLFMELIRQAQHRLWIASPYFVPDEQFVSQLQLAAIRGVDVRIMLPSRPDHRLVQLASYAYLKPLGDVGVRFFRYTPGFLHQKVVLIDDAMSSIGSVNFDNRSFRLNFEISILVNDRLFAQEVHRMLEADFERCKPLGHELLSQRGPMFNLAVRGAKLLAPVL
jgi:cardiolipin synthase